MSKPEWLNIDKSPNIEPILMLGRVRSGSKIEAEKAKTTKETKRLLEDIVDRFIARHESDEFLGYSDNVMVEEGITFFGKINDIAMLSGDGMETGGSESSLLLSMVEKAYTSNDLITLREFESKEFTFYAIVAMNSQGDSVAYVRRIRGFKVANNRWHIFQVGDNDSLDIYDKPIFKFDECIDFAVKDSDFCVWDIDNFLSLFVDVDALKSAVPSYLKSIDSDISIPLDSSTIENIKNASMGSIRLAKQVKRISKLKYLKNITVERMCQYLDQVKEVSEGIEVSDGALTVSESSVPAFLKLLEQRFWRGQFDDNLHEAQSFILT